MKVLEIFKTQGLKPVEAKVQPDGLCSKKAKIYSSEFWECIIDNYACVTYDAVGTCRMGYGSGDKEAVVDPKFR